MENAKVKQDLATLRKTVAESTDLDGSGRKGGAAAKKFMGQWPFLVSYLLVGNDLNPCHNLVFVT